MNNELFSRLKDLARKENRARLAVLLGAAAMLLILLSELFTPSGKTAAASAAPADDNIYRQQLEQQLSDLIAQVEGAGKTTVMVTLESGEETIYALDTLSGQTQEQQTMCCWTTGPRWHRQSAPPECAGWPWFARAGEMSGSPPASPSWWGRCWMSRPTASA